MSLVGRILSPHSARPYNIYTHTELVEYIVPKEKHEAAALIRIYSSRPHVFWMARSEHHVPGRRRVAQQKQHERKSCCCFCSSMVLLPLFLLRAPIVWRKRAVLYTFAENLYIYKDIYVWDKCFGGHGPKIRPFCLSFPLCEEREMSRLVWGRKGPGDFLYGHIGAGFSSDAHQIDDTYRHVMTAARSRTTHFCDSSERMRDTIYHYHRSSASSIFMHTYGLSRSARYTSLVI